MSDFMNDMGGLGLFDFFGMDAPIASADSKEKKKKDTGKKKSSTKTSDTKKVEILYKTPLHIVFDSMPVMEIEEMGTLTKEKLLAVVWDRLNLSCFTEHNEDFLLTELCKDSVYRLTPAYKCRVAKGASGTQLLLNQLSDLFSLMQPSEGLVHSVKDVTDYIREQYHVDTELYLIGSVYIPVASGSSVSGKLSDLHFPFRVNALTLDGESLEITEEDYLSFLEKQESEESENVPIEEEDNTEEDLEDPPESADTDKKNDIRRELLLKMLQLYFPFMGEKLDFSVNKADNSIQIHFLSITSNSMTTNKKEETFPTNAQVDLLFRKIDLTPEMFGGVAEVGKKEILRVLQKDYPAYSPERTHLTYDKKHNCIIPILQSGKRGNDRIYDPDRKYYLEDSYNYRKEISPLMSICVNKRHDESEKLFSDLVDLYLPKIPFTILKELVEFFWYVHVVHNTEAYAEVYYNVLADSYQVHIPYQRVSESEVHPEYDPLPENRYELIKVMEIHSHNTYPAFWSSTDNASEQSHMLYGVIGSLDRFRFNRENIIVRAGTGGYHVQMDISDVFQFPQVESEIHPDLCKIKRI